MTEPSQESSASELPSRPRVHQLAKHLGITSKELLAELSQLGHEVRSASSVVTADVVTAVLEAHTPEPEAVPAPGPGTIPEPDSKEAAIAEPPVEPQPDQSGQRQRRRRAASRPAGPPVDVSAPAETTTTAAATAEPAETTEPDTSRGPARRRRRATRRPGPRPAPRNRSRRRHRSPLPGEDAAARPGRLGPSHPRGLSRPRANRIPAIPVRMASRPRFAWRRRPRRPGVPPP